MHSSTDFVGVERFELPNKGFKGLRLTNLAIPQYLYIFIQTQMACTRMFHKRLVSPLFYTAPCNHFGTETHTVTHIGLGLFNSSFRTPGRTRTCNLRIRSALLYPVEPRVRKNVVLNHNAFIGASPEAFTFIFQTGGWESTIFTTN